MQIKWKKSHPLTVGVEWEFQILDRNTLQPKDIFEKIYDQLELEITPFIHKEVYQSMLEIVTPPCENEKEVLNIFRNIFENIKPLAEKENFHLIGLGTLFIKNSNATQINISPRYKLFAQEFQEILKDFYIYGIHIHIGIPSPDWAIRTFNNLVFYAPLLLALSANSIFYRGVNTGIHSYRMVLFERLPRAELPRQFKNFEEFEEIFLNLLKSKAIEGIKDIWWHIRPRPDFGTIEIRVFDSLWDLERLSFLIKLIRAIALYSEKYQDDFLPPEILNQNWWWAKRYSLDADFIDKKGRRALKQVAFDLIYKLEDLGILRSLNYSVGEFTKLLRKPSPAKELLFKSKAIGLEKVIKIAAVV